MPTKRCQLKNTPGKLSPAASEDINSAREFARELLQAKNKKDFELKVTKANHTFGKHLRGYIAGYLDGLSEWMKANG